MIRNPSGKAGMSALLVGALIGFFGLVTTGTIASTAPAFLPPVNYGSGGFAPVSLAVADLNGDGKPDLVAGNLSDGKGQERFLGVLLGNGDGSFRPAVPYDTGGLSLTSGDLTSIPIVIADVNGDGKLDLIVSNQGQKSGTEGSVAVLLGNGDGTFQPAVTYDSGGQFASSVAVADLNGDGKTDLIVANCAPVTSSGCQDGNGILGVLLGNGDGTFRPVQTYNSGSPELFSSPVLVIDINNDGKLDLLIANAGGNGGSGPGSIGVLLGNGDGTFQPVITYDSGGQFASSVAVADLNGDGKPDLVVGNFSGSVAVLLGNGDGTFQPAKSYGPVGQAFSLVITDVNGDGQPDLVTANFPNTASVLLGNGDGTFQAPQIYLTGRLESALAITDVNGDGKPDLIAANECADEECQNLSGRISVLLNNGDGTFQPAVVLDSGGNLTWSIAAADLNGDRRPDLINANYNNSTVAVLLNNTPFCTTPVITVSTNPSLLWPPNGKMVPVVVSGTITDTGCTVITAAYALTDEYGEVQPSGPVTLGADGSYSFTVLLPASRIGTDSDGRLYTVTVRAEDNAGNAASKTSFVTVPHDQGK